MFETVLFNEQCFRTHILIANAGFKDGKESLPSRLVRAVARALIGGGGRSVYSYIRVMPD